jgi:excinuclease ABC subunit B
MVVRPSKHQVDDLMEEIRQRAENNERTLVTTLTKRMAEELSAYLKQQGVLCEYIHSDVETLERVNIMDKLRKGQFDVLIGVNLLREGLDLPEVSLVAILDADKEGFLRNHRSLTQTAGRAARHINGKVILYADKITESMQLTLEETQRRRKKQEEYNKLNNITPTAIQKDNYSVLVSRAAEDSNLKKAYIEPEEINILTDPVVRYMSRPQLEKLIENTRKLMYTASKKMEFLEAAQYRDELYRLEQRLKEL